MGVEHSVVYGETLTAEQLENRVLQIPLADTSERTEGCVRSFIESAVFMLRRPYQVEQGLLVKYYTTCLLALQFLPPLFNIEVGGLKKEFCSIVSRAPYNVGRPFDVYFVFGGERWKGCSAMKSIDEITDDATRVLSKCRLSHAEEIRKQVISSAFRAHSAVIKRYTHELHAALLVYSRILPKLMGISGSEALKGLRSAYADIAKEHGDCEMRFPAFLEKGR